MTSKFRQDIRQHAAAIRERLDDPTFTIPQSLKLHAKTFITTQTAFEKAAVAADDAETARNDALAVIGEADDQLDGAVDTYADDISAAKLGPRQNPFKPFSKYAPSALKELAYATEAKEVRALVAEVAKKKPPASVKKSGAACLARCTVVEKALKEYGKPATAYTKALAARDALLPGMQKAIKTLKTHAASTFADDPASLAALFASPEAVQAPKKQRRAKKARPADEPAKAPVTNGAPPGP